MTIMRLKLNCKHFWHVEAIFPVCLYLNLSRGYINYRHFFKICTILQSCTANIQDNISQRPHERNNKILNA